MLPDDDVPTAGRSLEPGKKSIVGEFLIRIFHPTHTISLFPSHSPTPLASLFFFFSSYVVVVASLLASSFAAPFPPIYVYYSVLWCYEMSSHFSVKINVWITHNPPSLCVSFSLQIKRPAHPCVRHRRAQVSFQYTVCNCDEIDVNKRWIRMCFIFFVQTSSKKEKWEKNQLSTASKLKLHSELASVVACKSEYFCKYINCPTKKNVNLCIAEETKRKGSTDCIP